ncbi:steroid 5-alpha reductase [filamentous cyanobacterium CCT1]|nr:steroid 5-alpha reductase [filamentous cyanobacterium CCT1]PSN78206.1 steroid 5-alpha reductase [filamentous cyanobacterium CCP4]
MKIKHVINLHKGATAFYIAALMVAYQNFGVGPWVYLALHGTYGMLWLLKDRLYPDKQWEQPISLGAGVGTFGFLGLYWVAPFLLISRGVEPPLPLVAAAIALNILGTFLHYASDAQKYFTLKYQPGLITEGLFARCRNTNYLGEISIYLSFALLAMHWLPFAILSLVAALVFVPNMRKKDESLSRYPEFADYRARSGLLLPQLFRGADAQISSTGQPQLED